MVREQGLNLRICTSGWKKMKRIQMAVRSQLPVYLGLEKKACNIMNFGVWGWGFALFCFCLEFGFGVEWGFLTAEY